MMSRVPGVLSIAALAAAFALCPSPARAGSPTGAEVMERVENRNAGKDQIATVTLEIHPKASAARLRQLVMMRKEYDHLTKLVTFFQSPAEVRGAAFLVFNHKGAKRPDDQRWLYLPAIGQVRQLAAESNRQSFFNSDFVYEDLTNRHPDQDDHKLIGTQKVDDWECWVVESTPKNPRGLDFAKYKTWVWKTGDLIVRQEYFDASGATIKRGQVKSVVKVQDIWTWHEGVMENLKTGSSTKMDVSNVHYNTDIPDERFAESQLSRGAPNL